MNTFIDENGVEHEIIEFRFSNQSKGKYVLYRIEPHKINTDQIALEPELTVKIFRLALRIKVPIVLKVGDVYDAYYGRTKIIEAQDYRETEILCARFLP